MNRELKTVTAIGASALLLTALSAVAQQTATTPVNPPAQARESAGAVMQKGSLPAATKSAKTFSAQDQHFVTTAAQAGMAEVEMGKLAAANSSSYDVKMFAEQMVADHGKAGATLTGIAAGKGATAPADLSAKDKAELKKLQGLQGAVFDREYVKVQLAAHKDAVALFRSEAQKGSDQDLKSFAADTLPTLEAHLAMVTKLSAQKAG